MKAVLPTQRDPEFRGAGTPADAQRASLPSPRPFSGRRSSPLPEARPGPPPAGPGLCSGPRLHCSSASLLLRAASSVLTPSRADTGPRRLRSPACGRARPRVPGRAPPPATTCARPRPAPRRALPGGEPRVGAAALLGDWRQPEPPRGRRPHHGLSPSAPRESVRPGRRAPPGTRAGTRGPGHARTHVRGTPSPTAALACGKSRAAVAAGPQGAPWRPFRRRRDRWGVRRGRDGSPAAGSPEGVRGRARLGGAGHPNWLGLGGQTAGTHPGHPAKGYSLWSVLETKVKLKPSLG